MKKNLLFISIFLVSLMSLSIQGMEQHSRAIEPKAIDQSGRNLGDLGVLPDEMLYHIIDQGLPAQINTIQELEQAWNFIAHFAQINRHCAGMVQDEFISTILARKISKDKANELWKLFFDFKKTINNTYLRAIKALIKTGVDVNLQCNGYTALMWAAVVGHEEILQLLLLHGAQDVSPQDSNGNTALIRAASDGQKELVLLLLQQRGAQVNLQNNYDQTALRLAAMNGYKEIVKLLLQHGADVNLQIDVRTAMNGGRTALMEAAMNGHKDTVLLLLQYGALVNLQSFNGRTALMEASMNGHKDTVQLLLQHDAQVSLKDRNDFTAIFFATTIANAQEIEELLLEAQKRQAEQNNNNA